MIVLVVLGTLAVVIAAWAIFLAATQAYRYSLGIDIEDGVDEQHRSQENK